MSASKTYIQYNTSHLPLAYIGILGIGYGAGTNVMILPKIGVFDSKYIRLLCPKWIVTLVFNKNVNLFVENC
jgi:hypothetical protein